MATWEDHVDLQPFSLHLFSLISLTQKVAFLRGVSWGQPVYTEHGDSACLNWSELGKTAKGCARLLGIAAVVTVAYVLDDGKMGSGADTRRWFKQPLNLNEISCFEAWLTDPERVLSPQKDKSSTWINSLFYCRLKSFCENGAGCSFIVFQLSRVCLAFKEPRILLTSDS